jgi:hypothetical protein
MRIFKNREILVFYAKSGNRRISADKFGFTAFFCHQIINPNRRFSRLPGGRRKQVQHSELKTLP